MNSEQRDLWSRIRSFDIDGGPATLTFSKRLARENGWTPGYAERVIDEYRKFVFLCMAAGHKCTPSDEVDQAWHLHMIYTESYWTRFCGEVLPHPLHHGPTRGGRAESDKFTDWYERTKETYRNFFGEEPPADIWPSTQARFAHAAAWKRVDTSQFWMIPKIRLRHTASTAGLLGTLAIGGVGCGYLAQSSSSWMPILIIGIFLVVVFVWIIYAAATGQLGNNRKDGNTHGSGCGGGGCGSSSSGDSDGGGGGCGGGCGGCGG